MRRSIRAVAAVALVVPGMIGAGGCASSPAPEAPAVEPTRPAPAPEAPVVPSARFTVRLHAGEDAARADEVAALARERLEPPIEVTHEAGEYRVEVGELSSEAEAKALAGVARERGFPGATVLRLPPPPKATRGPAGPGGASPRP